MSENTSGPSEKTARQWLDRVKMGHVRLDDVPEALREEVRRAAGLGNGGA
jgi:ABC-type phosphonate transport system ATPase subunit